MKRWVQTDVVQNTLRCVNPTLRLFCVCYLLFMLIPANNFSFKSCVSFGWEGRNRCSWRLNLWAKFCCSDRGCSEPLRRMLSWYQLWDVLLRIFRCCLVVPVRIKGCCIYFFSLGGHKAVCCSSDEKNVAHSSSLPVFHRNASHPSLQQGLTWFMVVNRIRASAFLEEIEMQGKSATELLVSFFSSCDGQKDTPPSRGDLSGGSRQIICI